MHTSLKRGVSAAAALAALSGGLVAFTASPAAAVDAGFLASVTNGGNGSLSGTNQDTIALTAPAPCNASATRHVAKVISVVPTNAADQAEADRWAGDNLYAPVGVGLPGPLTVRSSGVWQDLADSTGQKLVPGKYNLELRCQNNLGTTIYEQWKGSVTFSSPTAWTADALTAPKVATTTAVAAAPQPVTAGQAITYTATVSESDPATPTGSVEFRVDGGAAQTAPVDATGKAVLSAVAPASGSHTVEAKYLGDTAFDASTGTGAFTTDRAPAAATTTALTASPTSGPAYQNVTLTGTVANTVTPTAVPTGSCDFFDGPTKVGTAPVGAAGVCTIGLATFGAGNHTFSAKFVPSDAALFVASTSNDVNATYDRPAADPDNQTIVVTVPDGNLSIFTPYTPANPLDLGNMVLSGDGKAYSASTLFDKVTITDTRAGNPGWTASLLRTDFVGADGTIPAKYSGFENVAPSYLPGNAVTSISVQDVPANDPAYVAGPRPFATATAGQGTGSVDVKGNFVLKGVPTSTKAGKYTATVVFTVG